MNFPEEAADQSFPSADDCVCPTDGAWCGSSQIEGANMKRRAFPGNGRFGPGRRRRRCWRELSSACGTDERRYDVSRCARRVVGRLGVEEDAPDHLRGRASADHADVHRAWRTPASCQSVHRPGNTHPGHARRHPVRRARTTSCSSATATAAWSRRVSRIVCPTKSASSSISMRSFPETGNRSPTSSARAAQME